MQDKCVYFPEQLQDRGMLQEFQVLHFQLALFLERIHLDWRKQFILVDFQREFVELFTITGELLNQVFRVLLYGIQTN